MIHIDIDSLTALRYFYNGETLGISKEEISRNEKQRKLLLPAVLKEFLLKYGSLGVNFGEGNVLPPDLMRIVDDKVIFAYMDDQAMLAFRRADFAEDNPQLFYVKPDFNEKETKISWRFIKASDFFMHNFLIGLVMCNLPRIDVQWEDPSQLEQSEVPEEVLNLLLTGQSDNLVFFTKKYRVFLCWDDEKKQLWSVFRNAEKKVLFRYYGFWTGSDMERLFDKYFFQKQNYAKALYFGRRLIVHLEKKNTNKLQLAEKYKLLGRCCWELAQWEEAAEFYQKAELFFNIQLEEMLNKAKSFYQSKGDFYSAWQNEAESRQAYAQVDRICEFLEVGGARAHGMRLVNQAVWLMEQERSEDDLRKALDLFAQALDIYQQDPKECKYDIARCQQLRGDLRKRLKELTQNKQS